MKVVSKISPIVNGVIELDLGARCECYIGILEIALPKYGRNNQIDICCSEIDSTLLNRKRLVRRIMLNRMTDNFHVIEFKNIYYEKVDSSDRYLHFYFLDEHGETFEFSSPNSKIMMTFGITNTSDET